MLLRYCATYTSDIVVVNSGAERPIAQHLLQSNVPVLALRWQQLVRRSANDIYSDWAE